MPHHLETVNITDLAAGGAGVGKLADGKIVFAPQTFPGDVALLQIDKQKKRHAFASMVSLQTPSSLRRQPECPHVHDCGGCLWMELDYTAQLRWKKSVVEQTMGRIGRIDMEAKPVVPSPVKLGYRHRVRLKGVMTQNGFTFAYRRRGGNDLAHINSCPVAHPRINQTMAGLSEFLSSRPTLAGSIDQTLFETDGVRCRATFFPTGAMSQSALEQMIGHVEGLDGATAMANGAILGQGGETWLNLKADDGPALWFSAGAFSQANLSLNPRLVARVMELCAMTEGDSGLDLYCGAGNFSIPLAVSGVSMSGVDFSEHAVASADRACQANSLVKAHFTQEDCLAAANTLIASRVKFSAVILNPPRAGAGEVFQKALELTDRRIVYVACDPAPLARDAALAAGSGFRLTGLDIFDMFPHTPHMETVALFEKD